MVGNVGKQWISIVLLWHGQSKLEFTCYRYMIQFEIRIFIAMFTSV